MHGGSRAIRWKGKEAAQEQDRVDETSSIPAFFDAVDRRWYETTEATIVEMADKRTGETRHLSRHDGGSENRSPLRNGKPTYQLLPCYVIFREVNDKAIFMIRKVWYDSDRIYFRSHPRALTRKIGFKL